MDIVEQVTFGCSIWFHQKADQRRRGCAFNYSADLAQGSLWISDIRLGIIGFCIYYFVIYWMDPSDSKYDLKLERFQNIKKQIIHYFDYTDFK